MMILFDNEEEATILQRNFEQLILMVEKSLSIIWPPEDTTGYQAHASQVWHDIYTYFKKRCRRERRMAVVERKLHDRKEPWFPYLVFKNPTNLHISQ